MNGFGITGLFFVAIPSAILGIFCLLKGRKKVHLAWSAFLASVVIWGIGMFKVSTSVTLEKSLFWWRIAEVGVILIPVFLIHFVIAFLGLKRKILLFASYLIGAFFIYLDLFTNYLIHDLYFAFNQFYYIKGTPFYTALILFFVLAVIYAIYELNRVYERSKGIIRTQIKYLILALFIGFSGGVTSYPPVYGIESIYPVWNGTIFIAVLMISYAILKYRLMDIRIIIRKFVFYVIMAGLVYGFFYLLLWFYNSFLGGAYTVKTYVVGLAVAPVFVAIFILINKWFKKITSRYLFYDLYNYQEAINKLAKELSASIDLNKIVDSIVDTIKETMNLNRAGVLLISKEKEKIHYKIAKVIGFNESNGISLVQDSFLTRYLEKTKKALIREELHILAKEFKNQEEKKSFEKLAKNLEKIEASLCLPLISASRLIGIVVLGSKNSGDAYSKEDLQLLEMLSSQAAVAIENAKLYNQVRNFNKTLKQKVNEQTAEIKQQKEEIQKAYEIEKKAHEELKKLDKAKDQFILATQHHLRTPVSGMSGYLDLMLGGSFGKVSKKMKEGLEKLQSATKVLSRLIDEFLDISQLQLGRKVVAIVPEIEVDSLLDEIIEEVSIEAERKKLTIKLEKGRALPKINADPEKLKTAIFNIVDNAVKYTTKGGVTIIPSVVNNNIQIEIKDTGRGIPQKNLKLIFKKLFERGEKADKFYATGRGIGLFMSTLIIEAHNGKIWAESQGQDKGSSFFIQLPIT